MKTVKPFFRTNKPTLGIFLSVIWMTLSAASETRPSCVSSQVNLSNRAKTLLSSVQPELAADAKLRLLKFGQFRPSEKIDELQAVFSLASQSPYPVRMYYISGNLDTKSGYLADTYNLELDQISLRSKAVREMLLINPKLAFAMFQEIGPLNLPSRSCADSLGYDVSSYYRVAGEVYRKAFDEVGAAEGARAAFLESVLGEVGHSSQIAPALEMLLDSKADSSVFNRGVAALGRAIRTIDGDARSFGSTDRMLSIDLYRLEELRRGENRVLFQGAKTYVESNLSHQVCRDDGFTKEFSRQNEFAGLNELLRKYDIAPITVDIAKIPSIGEPRASEEQEAYWQSVPAKMMLNQLKRVREDLVKFGPKSPDWQREATQLVVALRDWTDSSTEFTIGDLYLERAVLLSELLKMLPVNSPIFGDCLSTYIEFLSTPPSDQGVEVLWIWSIEQLLREIRSGNADSAKRTLDVIEGKLITIPNPSIALCVVMAKLDSLRSRN